ncbi:hypothetical protein GCM10010405_50670 [Streptomyces macrosporus]|uniref:Uncharacterized protein n=1 Tax=Streptomyces macrosporus TaxID=44032 RepID=A0ABN3KI20_9ACTN
MQAGDGRARASAVVPGTGRAAAMTVGAPPDGVWGSVSASAMPCTFAENRQVRLEAPTLRSRTGTKVPSTIHSRSVASAGRETGTIGP